MYDLSTLSTGQLTLFLALLALPIIPNLWTIWHAFRHEFGTPQEKMIWLSIAVFVPVLGGIAYLIWGRKRVRS